MKINCIACKDEVSLIKLIRFEHKTESSNAYLCFSCVRYINTLVAEKYREQGWQITKDALVVNINYNTEKESA